MATTVNAVKAMKKAGATVTQNGRRYIGQFPAAKVEVNDQDGTAITIYVIHNRTQDDLVTDYFAGTFKNTIKGAIELAKRMETY